jgi:hypothetical protein
MVGLPTEGSVGTGPSHYIGVGCECYAGVTKINASVGVTKGPGYTDFGGTVPIPKLGTGAGGGCFFEACVNDTFSCEKLGGKK